MTSCSKFPHIERQHGIAFLWALWFNMSGKPTLYAIKRNLKNMLALLFFNMFLFCYSVFSTYSMSLVRKGRRDICSQQLIELACTWSIGFQLLAAIQPYFQASSTFPIYISWLWCTPFMYTMICLVAVCSCYHGLEINSLYSILWTYHLPTILTSGAYFCVLVLDYINARTIL